MSIFELILICCGLGGHPLVVAGDRRGYWLWLLGCGLGMVFFIGRGMYGMAVLQGAYAVLNARALLRLRTPKTQ
jgi:hypothetical protein